MRTRVTDDAAPTLQDLRRRRFRTVKDFAQAGHMTMYQADKWLHARYGNWYIEAPENAHILPLFGVSLAAYQVAWKATAAAQRRKYREAHTC